MSGFDLALKEKVAELDKKLSSQIGDDISVIYDHEFLFKQSREMIATLLSLVLDLRESELNTIRWLKELKPKVQRIEVERDLLQKANISPEPNSLNG